MLYLRVTIPKVVKIYVHKNLSARFVRKTQRYGIAAILGKLPMSLLILLLQPTYRCMPGGSGCPPKTWNKGTLAIDSLRLRASKKRLTEAATGGVL